MSELLADADVLIDYCASDNARTVLGLIAHLLGPLHVPSPVLSQVRQLSKRQCATLGLTLVEPTFEQLARASRHPWGLSFEDALCVLLARANGWTCVTNDKRMLKVCASLTVATWRGLKPMIELVHSGALDPTQALVVAEDIRRSNPFHITHAIVQDFRDQVSLS